MNGTSRLEGVLDDVQARNVNTQYGSKVVYDLQLQGGPKLSCWDKPLTEKAWGMKGKNCYWDVEIRSSQDGKYTNYTLKEVGEAAGMEESLAAASMLGGNAVGLPTPQPAAAPAAAALPTVASTDSNKEQSIHRQVAAKVAAKLSNTGDEFWSNVNDLFTYFQTGATPSSGGVPKPVEPIGPGDDDIPF